MSTFKGCPDNACGLSFKMDMEGHLVRTFCFAGAVLLINSFSSRSEVELRFVA